MAHRCWIFESEKRPMNGFLVCQSCSIASFASPSNPRLRSAGHEACVFCSANLCKSRRRCRASIVYARVADCKLVYPDWTRKAYGRCVPLPASSWAACSTRQPNASAASTAEPYTSLTMPRHLSALTAHSLPAIRLPPHFVALALRAYTEDVLTTDSNATRPSRGNLQISRWSQIVEKLPYGLA
jgi:hypothetical protein